MLDLFSKVYKDKKVLVTGDTGFKGSWLCIWLKELGAEVYGYSLPPLTSQDNFVTTGLSNKINHIDGDIRNKEQLKEYVHLIQPEIVFHLAAQPLVLESYNNPHYNFETNVMGTVNLLEAVRTSSSVKAIINVTTDKCYQNNEWIWGYRENDAMGGEDPYSASKGCSELITHSYLKSFFNNGSTFIASARAGNVIGGGDWAENRIIPDIIRAYQSNTELVVRNANAVRPWQFVLEPVYGYLKLGQRLLIEGKEFSGAWNFGPSAYENYSVGNVIEEVMKTLPTLKIKTLNTDNKQPHEARLLKLDITKAVNLLGWKPKLNFEQTIQFSIEGYIQELGNKANCYNSRVEQINKYCNL